MIADDFDNFFLAVAGAAAALIGLLFVAISVVPGGITGPRPAAVHQLRATVALTSFVSALVLSLIALVPQSDLAWPATVVGAGGAVLFATSLLRLHRERRRTQARGQLRAYALLVGFVGLMLFVASSGVRLMGDADNTDLVGDIAYAVIALLVGGIDRSWELVGGPTRGAGGLIAEVRRGGTGSPRVSAALPVTAGGTEPSGDAD